MKRVGKGRIKKKEVKIFPSSKNFVEGKKKKASCADFLIKRSDAVGQKLMRARPVNKINLSWP